MRYAFYVAVNFKCVNRIFEENANRKVSLIVFAFLL
jgi:hypothetical protein